MKTDERIDDYVAKAPAFAQPILQHLRARAHKAAPEAEEAIKWGMPSFVQNKQILFTMGAFKEHAALTFHRGDELMGDRALSGAMGQFGKLGSLDDLPDDETLDALIAKAAALAQSGKPRPRKASPSKPERLHPEFAAAMDAAPEARATYVAFSRSHRREYCDWINEAKRDETRARRIAQAIEMLGEGKSRNWKYQNC